MALVLRQTKGSKLTIAEGDGNFEYLKEIGWDVLGWERYFDGQYTEANKRTLTASQDNSITINGATTLLTQSPINEGHLPFWSANKIKPSHLGDSFLIRFDFDASINNNDGRMEFSVDVGGTVGKAVNNTFVFPKGNGVPHKFSMVTTLYSLATFITNGGTIKINPSHTMLIWNQSIYIEKTFHGR
jgi:hypothetical protein